MAGTYEGTYEGTGHFQIKKNHIIIIKTNLLDSIVASFNLMDFVSVFFKAITNVFPELLFVINQQNIYMFSRHFAPPVHKLQSHILSYMKVQRFW